MSFLCYKQATPLKFGSRYAFPRLVRGPESKCFCATVPEFGDEPRGSRTISRETQFRSWCWSGSEVPIDEDTLKANGTSLISAISMSSAGILSIESTLSR